MASEAPHATVDRGARWRALFSMTSGSVDPHAHETTLGFLQRTSLFGGLEPRALARLERIVHHRTFADGETIYEQGRPGTALFLLRSGEVRITRRDAQGNEVAISTLRPPASFEEMAALDAGVVRWTSAKSVGRSELLALSRADLQSFARRWPVAANKALLHLAEAVARQTRAVLAANSVVDPPPP